MDIKTAINNVVFGKDLSSDEMKSVFEQIMTGEATDAQIGSFITALRFKGETSDEIAGAAMVMRDKALKIKVEGGPVLDTCGTGGTGADTFNISTTAAFVLAACGVKVAKHGNRGITSSCGSADVLKELGVNVDPSVEVVEECVNDLNIGFLFAPKHHEAMKYAINPRREIGIRTIFNVLGPLSNPALATCQVLGVYEAKLTEVMAEVLNKLGTTKAFVVHGLSGLDEVTVSGPTKVSELSGGEVKTYEVSPGSFGLGSHSVNEIKGGAPSANAAILKSVLGGEKGARRDVVLMNTSMALLAADVASDLKDGVKIAASAIDSGKALEKLEQLIDKTNSK